MTSPHVKSVQTPVVYRPYRLGYCWPPDVVGGRREGRLVAEGAPAYLENLFIAVYMV